MKSEFYRGPTELLVDKVSFNYYDGWYSGRGVVEWDPEKGFRLLAFVDRKTNPLQGYGIGRSGLITAADRKYIRLRFQGGEGGIISRVTLVDRIDILMGNHLDLRFAKIHLFRERGFPFKSSAAGGRAVFFGFGARPHMPDVVKTRKQIGTGKSSPGWSRSALEVSSRMGLRAVGELFEDDKTLLQLEWYLKPRIAERGSVWQFPRAMEYALTFATGRRITTVETEVETSTWRRRTVSMKPKPNGFGILALHESEFLDTQLVGKLAAFFYQNSKEAQVARRIIDQIANAAEQTTWEGTELLTATVLEAALRTLQNAPLSPKGKSRWKTDAGLASFRSTYMNTAWKRTCNEVLAAWRNLRHRNAHPSWLTEERRSDAIAKAALQDMALLSRFYGAMILAMAGQRPSPPLATPI